MYKRFTGGGTVVCDRDTVFVTFIRRPGDELGGLGPRQIMEYTGKVYKGIMDPLLRGKGVEFDLLGGQDYSVTRTGEGGERWDRKVGGNAQAVTRGGWCHHTSFLWRFKEENMGLLKEVRGEKTHARARRRHHAGTPMLNTPFIILL